MGLTFGAVLSSALAYSLYAYGLTKVTATDSSVFTYLDPVVGTVMGAVLLHEAITAYFLFGCALIFGGILLAEGHLPHYPIHRLRSARAETTEHKNEILPSRSEKQVIINKSKILRNIFEKQT